MTVASYVVTERAGPWVAGRQVQHGATLLLTAAEAAYELGEGTIVPDGAPLPSVEPVPAVLPTDIVTIRRDGSSRECTVADLLELFESEGETLDFSDPSNSGHLPGIGG